MVLQAKIQALKERRRAVILAHYYTPAQVQQVADFVGDSLALAQAAATTRAQVILFAGVHFMGETAKILCPEKRVLLPDTQAGCSLADSCPAADFERFIAQHPGHTVISYVNTTAAVKALTDIACTSSNAVEIVQSLPPNQPLIFGPDRNLGRYIQAKTGRQNMLIWDGACHVHEGFSLEKILELKQLHPAAKIIAHPECPRPIISISDFVGSTAQLIGFVRDDSAREYVVVTEPGVLHEMRRVGQGKKIFPAPPAAPAARSSDCSSIPVSTSCDFSTSCDCNECVYMKLNTLPKIAAALENLSPEITLEESIRSKAETSIRRMLEISKQLGLL